jgi:DNA-directed RNA polymerase subunit H (RpoH/RPB5)
MSHIYAIYIHLCEAVEHRGGHLEAARLAEDAFTIEMKRNAHVKIRATRTPEDLRGAANILAILFDTGSEFSSRSKEVTKLFSSIDTELDNLELMLVTEKQCNAHVLRKLQEIANSGRYKGLYYSLLHHRTFFSDVTKHVQVPHHELISPEEIDEFCKAHNTEKTHMRKIKVYDVQAIWLGLRPGMAVKVTRISETAGNAIAYLLCEA